DDYSYLSPSQREAILHFVDHFKSSGAVKEGFLSIWRILLPLYRSFRSALKSKGMSYEGMVYRELAENLEAGSAATMVQERFPWSERFVFVGLNALNECEKALLRKLHRAGLAEFCWDYRSDFIRNTHNKSSLFLRDFTLEFPSAFQPDPDGLPDTEFNVLSVPGGIAQAKQLPQILARCCESPGIETAVVLPDEQLLIPVLNSIPPKVQKLNVTMGYPIAGSQMWTLLGDLGALQLHLRQSNGEWHFYHRQLWAVASNSMVKSVLTDEGKKLLEKCRNERKYYVPQGDLQGDPVLEVLFRPVVTGSGPVPTAPICQWLQEVLATLGPRLKSLEDMQFELDFAKLCHEAVGRLLSYNLELQPSSFFRLLMQVLSGATVPFEGEPLEGLQIMGPLELRAMDFQNLIILSCNEGVFPRRSVSSSFIPPELRKGFGLPTYEYQDAVWAYYFYRMIQRCSRVWMVYDSRTEGLKSGEPSRYLRQLEMHFDVKFNHFEAQSSLGRGKEDGDIPKTLEDLEALRAQNLSASAVKSYLTCPAQFYYAKVRALEAKKEVSESLDAGMFGTVLHAVMQELYPRGTVADAAFIGSLLKSADRIKSIVNSKICKELKTFEVSGRNLVFADVICSYVEAVLKADLEQVKKGGPLRILGAELLVKQYIRGFKFVGYIDRLDSSSPGNLRVVDYKTGRVNPDDLDFGTSGEIPQIGLQLYLYKRLLSPDYPGAEISGAIYQPASIIAGEGLISHSLDQDFCSRMDSGLDSVLDGICDLYVPWQRTDKRDKCTVCDFRAICGR
ncbi:MAG: PD-(D/E)XK nuclease family protein, partial [Bacteroidales bacterium]|nr:PD-(D/E)XK nuclease family protein [Bacteroidales bacterium]